MCYCKTSPNAACRNPDGHALSSFCTKHKIKMRQQHCCMLESMKHINAASMQPSGTDLHPAQLKNKRHTVSSSYGLHAENGCNKFCMTVRCISCSSLARLDGHSLPTKCCSPLLFEARRNECQQRTRHRKQQPLVLRKAAHHHKTCSCNGCLASIAVGGL